MTIMPETELDGIGAYEASLTYEHRRDLAAASAAMDLYILLYRARESRGLSQAAANLAALQQHAVSRLEQSTANPQFGKIVPYLNALGHGLAVQAVDLDTGEAIAEIVPRGNFSAPHHGTTAFRPKRNSSRTSAGRPGRVRKPAPVLVPV